MERTCPKAFAFSAAVQHANGLYGYEFLADAAGRSIFNICFCDPGPEEAVAEIRRLSGSQTLALSPAEGSDRLTIGWHEHALIPEIFGALLKVGRGFWTANRAMVRFEPASDQVFSAEAMEQKLVKAVEELFSSAPLALRNEKLFYPHRGIWNYVTEEGRELCRRLRRQLGMPPAEWGDPANYFSWPSFRPLAEIPPAEPEEEPCMVCLDALPDMKYLPCGHVVVCGGCFERLKRTFDHHTCVKCRRPITEAVPP